MGKGKNREELENERRYVAGARVWLGLTKLKLEMALNYGRPVLLPDDESVHESRRLLEHPLSVPTDSRVVAACELLYHRQIQITPFSSGEYLSPTRVDMILESGNKTFDDWEDYWTSYYVHKGISSTNFLVSERKCPADTSDRSLRHEMPLDSTLQLSYPAWRSQPKRR